MEIVSGCLSFVLVLMTVYLIILVIVSVASFIVNPFMTGGAEWLDDLLNFLTFNW